ncbi:MAG: leucine-rich repeat protein [Clostridia bacterium]|nr:leucine-rich repeat protein [Clostridia bacterium]
MKKKLILVILMFAMVFLLMFGLNACSKDNTVKDNTVKYIYTNSQGEVSYFEIDFDKNEYTYNGNACYREGWGYMLIPNTSYEVTGYVRLDYKINGYTVYEFSNHPWNNKYTMSITSDGNILQVQWTEFSSYDFIKEGYLQEENSSNNSNNENSGNNTDGNGSSSGDSSSNNENSGNNAEVFYDVTFHCDTLKLPETVTVKGNSVLELPVFELEGYTFNGWDVNGQIKQAGETVTVTENMRIDAKISVIIYTITYNLNGGQLSGEHVRNSYAVYNLPYVLQTPRGTGTQSFVKWTTDEAGENEITTITELGNYTLYAQYVDSAKCLTYKYSESLQGYEVSAYTGNAREVKIPSIYRGVEVKAIGDHAFSECYLTNITIPDSITNIGYGAFYYSSITSITIPNSVTSIDDNAFNECNYITSITIPNSVTSIGTRVFSGCDSLKTVTFEENSQLRNIGYWVFDDCSKLTSITIPDSVTSIGSFGACIGLTEIVIPESVTRLDSSAFNGCVNLKTMIINSDYVVNGTIYGEPYDFGELLQYAMDVYIRADIVVTPNIYSVIYNNLGKETLDGVEYYHYQIKPE